MFRDGFCNTGNNDIGTHTVCAIVSDEFLLFSKKKGNDLTTDIPIYNFKVKLRGLFHTNVPESQGQTMLSFLFVV